MHYKTLTAITLALATLNAHANMSVQVTDDSGYSLNLNLSPFSHFNAQTGDFSLDLSSIQTPVNDGDGQWSLGTTQVYDRQAQSFKTVDAISWHNWAATVTFAAIGNIDPEMSYGFFAKNTSNATQTYTVNHGEAMSPDINGPYTLHAEISGSVTNPSGTGAVSIAQVPGFSRIQAVRLSSDGGATFVNGGVNVGHAYDSNAVGSRPYGEDQANTTGTGHYNYWDFQTQFRLSAKDTFSLTGYAEITPVPEPASWMLPVVGLAVLLTRRRQAN